MQIKLAYNPRPYFKQFHASNKRFKILVCHRRAGKTLAAINETIKEVLTCPRPNPRGFYVAPTFSQAKDIAWTYLKDFTRSIPGMSYYESELRADFPTGARIKLFGAENPDRMRGIYVDVAVIDEYASMSPTIWTDVLRPALSDRQGRAIFLGTPKGQDAFYDLWTYALEHPDEWFALMLRASDTGILSPKELYDSFSLMGESKYAREYECDFSASFEGAYYLKQMMKAASEKRIRHLPYDPAADVYSCWDLGIADAMARWDFQVINDEWRWLYYYENTGFGIDHYINEVKQRPYLVDMHFLPHDAAARELQTGKSRQQFMEERGLKTHIVQRHSIEDGINATRLVLERSYFDDSGTKDGRNAIGMYKADYKDKLRILTAKPVHDWASHAADSMRTGVMGIDEYALKVMKKSDWSKPVSRASAGTYV